MSRENSRSRWPRRIRLLVVSGAAAMALATAMAQAPSQSRPRPPAQGDQRPAARKGIDRPDQAVHPTPGPHNYRYAPTLAVLMVAYEGVVQDNEKANPELVRALRKTFAANPSARQTLEKVHRAYRAMTPADREKIVGRELAAATGATPLSRARLEPILKQHFRREPALLAERLPRVTPADLVPVVVPDREMQLDPETKKPERPIPLRVRTIGAEAREGSSTTYRVDYSGLYCRHEPPDFGLHCEPYVIFTMKQGDSQWTVRKGPYERCDSGDRYRERVSLRNGTPFRNDLYVVPTVFEHDWGSPEEIEDAVSSGVDTLAGIVDHWWETPDWLKDAVVDVLTWFADIFGLEDDQIGQPQSIRFTRAFAESHTGAETTEGILYDTFRRYRGTSEDPRGSRGEFYVYLNVSPL